MTWLGVALSPSVPTYRPRVLASYPHDRAAFTQGLYFDSGTLIESTGLYGQSELRRVDPANGRVLQKERLPMRLFGEGATRIPGSKVLQLTWREQVMLIRDLKSFSLLQTESLPNDVTEGWGITHDEHCNALYLSNGTSVISVLDPYTLQVLRTCTVCAGHREVQQLNDLQWINGELWANIWREERLAVIDPNTGSVRCFVDLSCLLSSQERRVLGYEEVLNGLAWDPDARVLYATGKCWPRLFALDIGEALVGSSDP